MYQDTIERRVTLYVRRAVAGNTETSFRHATENGVDVFYWIDGDFGYALSGQIGRQAIRLLADAAYSPAGHGSVNDVNRPRSVGRSVSAARTVAAPEPPLQARADRDATASAILMPSTPADRMPPA